MLTGGEFLLLYVVLRAWLLYLKKLQLTVLFGDRINADFYYCVYIEAIRFDSIVFRCQFSYRVILTGVYCSVSFPLTGELACVNLLFPTPVNSLLDSTIFRFR